MIPRLLLLLCLVLPTITPAQAARELELADGNTLNIEVQPADGRDLFILMPSEAGPQPGDQPLVEALAGAGIESWRIDPMTDRFLPLAASSVDQLPGSDIAALIETARSEGKRVFLVGTGRAAIPLLRGAREWQLAHPHATGLAGAILLSPKLFVETPDPGKAGELMPITRASNLPLFILQAGKSPWAWKLDRTIPALEEGGSTVFVQHLKQVRDRFHFRPDADAAEQAMTQRLPHLLTQAARLLNTLPDSPRRAVAQKATAPEVRIGKKERKLTTYAGDPTPPPLQLAGLNGEAYRLEDYRGRVVMVNFWASWCPPCVHEMPSMQRLQNSLHDKPFTILAVNMAEDAGTVREFLHTRVSVDFPILMDRDGDALKRWGVFAFPTTYVIGKQGRIRFALFGGVEWDQPELVDQIKGLLDE